MNNIIRGRGTSFNSRFLTNFFDASLYAEVALHKTYNRFVS